jgi:hypothetical protein
MLPLRVMLPLVLLFAPVAVVGVALLLVFRGDPGDCASEREIINDPRLAFAYDDRWLEFNDRLLSGLPATLAVSESEATSRAELFLASSSAPVEDVRVCFVDDGAHVNGTISTPFGPDVRVRIEGRTDLSGRHPEAEISSIKLGALPGFVTRPFRGLVRRIVDDQMEQIELDHRLTVALRDGEATVTGEP